MSDNVVFLEFRTKNADTETVEILACKSCRNKNWVVHYINDEYPILKCSACHSDAGKIGWVHKD